MNALPITKPSGFSLIELMIGISILAILLGLALPSFQTWLKNIQIRNAAESITNGLQRARTEAVAKNTNTIFTLNADTSWSVDYAVLPGPTPSPIDSRQATEGSNNLTLTAWVEDLTIATTVPPTLTITTPPATVTFNNFGGLVTTGPSAATSLAQVKLDASGGTQSLRVNIVGGGAKMCDCSLAVDSGPRACLTAC